MQNKYSIFDYWKNKVSNHTEFWSGLFEGIPLSRQSVIINPVILNSFTDQLEAGWIVYPNVYSVIGFLEYIYLPSAFLGLFESEKYQYYYTDELSGILDELKVDFPEKKTLITRVERLYEQLRDCWLENNEENCMVALKNWTSEFNRPWFKKQGVSFSCHVFHTPMDVAEFIIKGYEEYLGLKAFEEDTGITKAKFLEMANEQIYENEFMKKQFTQFITNSLKITF